MPRKMATSIQKVRALQHGFEGSASELNKLVESIVKRVEATEVALKELQNTAEVHALRDSLRADLLEAQQERVQDLESKFLEKEEQRRALREASSVLGKLQEEKAVREEAIAHITQGFKRGCAAVGERFKRVEEEVERLKLTVGLRIGGVQSDGDGDSDGDSDEETSANSDEPKEQTQRLVAMGPPQREEEINDVLLRVERLENQLGSFNHESVNEKEIDQLRSRLTAAEQQQVHGRQAEEVKMTKVLQAEM